MVKFRSCEGSGGSHGGHVDGIAAYAGDHRGRSRRLTWTSQGCTDSRGCELQARLQISDYPRAKKSGNQEIFAVCDKNGDGTLNWGELKGLAIGRG